MIILLVENTHSTGAEVAGVQKSRRNNGFKASYFFAANSSTKDWSGSKAGWLILSR